MAKYKPEIDSFRTQEAMRYLLNLLRNYDACTPLDKKERSAKISRKKKKAGKKDDDLFEEVDAKNFFGGSEDLPHSRGERIGDPDVFAVAEHFVTCGDLIGWYVKTIPEKIRDEAEEHHGRDHIDFGDVPREVMRCLWCDRAIRPHFVAFLEKESRRPSNSAREGFHANFLNYCDTLRLSPLERDLLLVSYLLYTDYLEWPGRHRDISRSVEFLAMYVDCSAEEVRTALSSTAPLRRYGCLDSDLDFCGELAPIFEGVDKKDVGSRFFRRDTEKPLPWEWFGELVEHHGAILRRMLAPGTGPGNILLYGLPGTGKTSFVRSLAAATGRECLFVRSMRGARRFGAVRACDNSADPDRNLIVVDECDALLLGMFGRGSNDDDEEDNSGDKGALNMLLDELRTPAVWICNANPRFMDDSNLRRFVYSVRFDAPTEEQRTGIWRNQVSQAGLCDVISEEKCRDFASRWQASAGGIAGVLHGVARLHPGAGEVASLVESFMKPHCELLGIEPSRDDLLRPAKDYSLDGLSLASSVPLPRIVEAARTFQRELAEGAASSAIDSPRLNLLLSGPPGTGKTEFVKYLGSELGTKVVVKMGSNLLNCYVGGTEANIAAAFREAEASNAILFLDEVDGLLRSRASARNSWEVTQVNELLHQMENFRGILVCATNFSDNLDPATIRRFTFKVVFDYLTNDGKAAFFERMFQRPLTHADRTALDAIPRLAPGDFRTVRQGMRYLGGGTDNAALLDALRDESKAKRAVAPSAERGRVGF